MLTDRDVAQDREITPSDLDWLEDYKCDAYKYHDALVEMGGRPTRQVLEKPAGKAIYGKDEIRIVNDHGKLQGSVALDENLTLHHWMNEHARFKEELDRWKEFRSHQQTSKHKHLLRLTLDEKTTGQKLNSILVRLNDWREFQYYQQQVKVRKALMFIWRTTEVMKRIIDGETIYTEFPSRPETEYVMENYFRHSQVFSRQMDLEASRTQLAWIEDQILEILAEACASLEIDVSLQQQLEMKLQQQANAFDQELKYLKARQVRSVQPPHQTAGIAQKLCHWGSEITRLMHEHFEWEAFVGWRAKRSTTEEIAGVGEQVANGHSSDLQFWRDYVSYRQTQLDGARSWAAGWEILLKVRENDVNTTPREHLSMLESTISGLGMKIIKFQKDVQTAELRVRSAERQLGEIASPRSCLGTSDSTQQSNMHPSLRLGPRDSESTSIIPEDSTLPKDHRKTSSTISPVTGIRDSVRSSNVLTEDTRAIGHDNTKRQLVTGAEAVVPDRVIAGNDVQTTFPDGAIGDGEESRILHTPRTDVKDTLMNDVKDLVNNCSGSASKVHSNCRSTKAPPPTHQAPISRKIRSAKTLGQPFSRRVLKHAGKKPTRNAKASTRPETIAMVSATSLEESPTDSPPRRRSQRIKEKALASVSAAAP